MQQISRPAPAQCGLQAGLPTRLPACSFSGFLFKLLPWVLYVGTLYIYPVA